MLKELTAEYVKESLFQQQLHNRSHYTLEAAVGYFENIPVIGDSEHSCAEDGPGVIPESVSAFGITANIG